MHHLVLLLDHVPYQPILTIVAAFQNQSLLNLGHIVAVEFDPNQTVILKYLVVVDVNFATVLNVASHH